MPLILKARPVTAEHNEAHPCSTTTPSFPALDLAHQGSKNDPRLIPRNTDINDLPAWMTEEEVAAYLSITPAKLRRLAYERAGPKFKKLGRLHLFSRKDVIEWLIIW